MFLRIWMFCSKWWTRCRLDDLPILDLTHGLSRLLKWMIAFALFIFSWNCVCCVVHLKYSHNKPKSFSPHHSQVSSPWSHNAAIKTARFVRLFASDFPSFKIDAHLRMTSWRHNCPSTIAQASVPGHELAPKNTWGLDSLCNATEEVVGPALVKSLNWKNCNNLQGAWNSSKFHSE